MPRLPPAPARLSTITFWPSDFDIVVARMRAMMSAGPPAANGTIMMIGRSGYAARAGTHASAKRLAINAAVMQCRRAMVSPPDLFVTHSYDRNRPENQEPRKNQE